MDGLVPQQQQQHKGTIRHAQAVQRDLFFPALIFCDVNDGASFYAVFIHRHCY